MKLQLSPSQFSVVPGEALSKKLLTSFQESILDSIQQHLKSIALKIDLNLGFLEDKIAKLDSNQRFSPVLFGIYARLREGYQRNHLESLFESLQRLRLLSEEEFYSPTRRYSSILCDPWETAAISEIRNELLPNQADVQMLPLIHWKEEDFPPVQLKKAEAKIKEIDPDVWQEFETYVSNIKLFIGKSLESITSPRYFGAIYLRIPSNQHDTIVYYLSTILHEAAHLHLFAMMGEDRFVLNERDELFDSPLRKDKRPMSGILHATFVLARIFHFFNKYVSQYSCPSSLKIVEESRTGLHKGLETIRQHSRLTEAGKSLFKSLERYSFE